MKYNIYLATISLKKYLKNLCIRDCIFSLITKILSIVTAGFVKQAFTNRNVLLDDNKLLQQKLQVLNKNEKKILVFPKLQRLHY